MGKKKRKDKVASSSSRSAKTKAIPYVFQYVIQVGEILSLVCQAKNESVSSRAVSLAVIVLSCCLAPVHAASFSSASSSSSGSGGSWTTTNCVNGVCTTTTSDDPAPVEEDTNDAADDVADDQDNAADPVVPEDDPEEDVEEAEDDPFADFQSDFESRFEESRARLEERRSRFQNGGNLADAIEDEDGDDSMLGDQDEDSADDLDLGLVDMMMMMPVVDEDNSTDGNNTNTTEPVPVVPIDVTGARAALGLHNDYRAMHQVDALGWSSDVEESAKYWANTLAADDCSMYHSSRDQRNGYGENLAIGHSNIGEVVADWYNEVSDYDFSDPGYSGATGHFTAVVWKGTTGLGCAIATCPEGGRTPGRKIYVCQYSPPGNVEGRFAENVFPKA